MRQKPAGRPSSSEQVIKDIKRNTRKQYGAEEKIRIVLDGLRGEVTELRREARELKEVVAEQTLELRLLKKSMLGDGGDP
jgi:transposase